MGHHPRLDQRAHERHPRALGPFWRHWWVQSLCIYTDAMRTRTYHLRTKGGEHEVDVIIETTDRRVLAFEVKASPAPRPGDTKRLLWLRSQLEDRLVDTVIVTTSGVAHRDEDSIAVVPAARL